MLLKNFRIVVLVAFIMLSVVMIAPNPSPSGFKITHVSDNLSAKLQQGEILYKINGFDDVQEIIFDEYSGTVKFETNKGVKFAPVNGRLGIEGEPADTTNLKFGLDIKGGTRAFIRVNSTDPDTMKQVLSTLQNRINFFGLREASFRQVDKSFIEISMAGGSSQELETLLEQQGTFEARIPLLLTVRNNMSQLRLGSMHNISVSGDTIVMGDKTYAEGDVFEKDGIEFLLSDVSQRTINMTSTVFTGDDIKAVFYDPQRSRVQPVSGGFSWSFAVQISREGAERFSRITKNLDVIPAGGESYLSSQISFYLDGELLDSLNIVSSLKGREETEISITGSSASVQEATTERTRLQSILRSGALPVNIEILQIDSVSPTLGAGFLRSAVLAAVVAMLGIIVVVVLRYRKFSIVLPMIITAIAEVVIILGISVAIGWTIDVAAVAGIIAAVGTGIDSQIIIIDQALRGEKEALREKLRDAFFIIFGAAGTVIAAMLPLMIIGFGALRGFAITTMIGVFVGILITRPAFGAIVERLLKD